MITEPLNIVAGGSVGNVTAPLQANNVLIMLEGVRFGGGNTL
jgi:hypothetical protein